MGTTTTTSTSAASSAFSSSLGSTVYFTSSFFFSSMVSSVVTGVTPGPDTSTVCLPRATSVNSKWPFSSVVALVFPSSVTTAPLMGCLVKRFLTMPAKLTTGPLGSTLRTKS